jgi:hypothetical protein
MKQKQEESIIFNTKKINEILDKDNKGIKLNRDEHIWFNNQSGVRKAGIKFSMTPDEIVEYAKCKLSVQYFAENFCQIKREDGSIGKMKLRDYQKDIIDLYTKHSRSILMSSRQSGKCLLSSSYVKININNIEYEMTIGELYYMFLREIRNLTLIEKLKFKLYQLYRIIDK